MYSRAPTNRMMLREPEWWVKFCRILSMTVKKGELASSSPELLTWITRADAPVVVPCHAGGNICIDVLIVRLLFPPPGTRISNSTSHETGQGLNYLHHGNLQVQQTKTFFFLESWLSSTWVWQGAFRFCGLNCRSSWSRLNLVTFTKVRENFAHTMAPGWGLEIKWQGVIKILQSAFLAACSKKG